MGSQAERTRGKVVAGGPGWVKWRLEDRGQQGSSWWSGRPHIPMLMNGEEQLGSETDHTTQSSSVGN